MRSLRRFIPRDDTQKLSFRLGPELVSGQIEEYLSFNYLEIQDFSITFHFVRNDKIIMYLDYISKKQV